MNALKPFLIACLSVLLFSCKDKPKPATNTTPQPIIDTTAIDHLDDINKYPTVDVSPMDMSYFPVDYPKLKMAKAINTPPIARVVYSRPHLAKRRFHDVRKYGVPWRLGANESTEIEFFRPVTIQDQKVAPGRYIIYCVPFPDKWTIDLNSNVDTWGLEQDSTKNVHQFDIPITIGAPPLEYFTMIFEKTSTGADLIMAWDDVLARLPIRF